MLNDKKLHANKKHYRIYAIVSAGNKAKGLSIESVNFYTQFFSKIA